MSKRTVANGNEGEIRLAGRGGTKEQAFGSPLEAARKRLEMEARFGLSGSRQHDLDVQLVAAADRASSEDGE